MFGMIESAKADANPNKGDIHMSLGKVIRKYRKIKNLTQEEMAGRLGVTAPAVNKWENENSYPDITLLAPIARLLGISVDTLLSFREALTPEEISGIMFPIDLLPDFLEAIGRIFPASWGYRLMLDNGFCLENLSYLILVFCTAVIICAILLNKQKSK